ncbi:putative bifunctional diguanylate cyclase/phosphodiesterase [Micromonospora sp. CPCC 206061]|uniref:putative bifunctional diguanylate cyclase/phosphodiesterase n=1 Tax=Micromonospora sp. CPCC 206061 TaxID=3122410 RepID=UPI002FF20D90
MERSAPPGDGVGPWAPAAIFAAAGIAITILYALTDSTTVAAGAFTVIALATVVALVVGPRRHGAQPRRPWQLLAAAGMLFLIGALIRPWAAEQTGAAALLGDAFTLPGYLFMFLSLGRLLRSRGSLQRHAVIDGLIVCVGAGLASTLLLAMPAAAIEGRPRAVSVLAGLYPLLDVVLVLLLASLAFTTHGRRPSYVLLLGGLLLLLAGDIGYAIMGVNGNLAGSALADLPFLLTFTLIGAAALHPSIADVSRLTVLRVQAWSWRRLLLIGPALVVPYALTAVVADEAMAARVVLAAGGTVMVSLLLARAVSAVQDYAAAQVRSEYQATHDPLTDLPNRLMLTAEISRRLATAPQNGDTTVWVLFLDLDGFKLVNDSWGHEAGDQLLIEVAARLRDTVPEPAMVARVGGDEFVVACTSTRPETLKLVDRIMDRLSAPLNVGSAEVVITPSIGVVGAPAGMAPVAAVAAVTAEALMRDADTAMYRAKSDGRGRWTEFDASMHERVRDRVEIELALRHALTSGQLRLAYQPIVELSTGRLVGAEALIRWTHPTRGPISPTTFIPIAEDSGLISAIGRWALDQTLRQLSIWRRDKLVADDFWISVNVSPRQLRDAGLPGILADTLTKWGVPNTGVVLEITESVMIDASSVTDQVLFDLRRLGVKIVVDDFGTGFSALGYLRRHPVTGVKIDRSFVDGLGTDAEDEEIVRAVVAMSAALKLTVVAEGVETPTQQNVLAALGVVVGQGHLWSAPVTPQEFTERWLTLEESIPDPATEAQDGTA